MDPLDIWTFEFEDEAKAEVACSAINGAIGFVAEISETNKRLVIISAPAEIMERAAEIAVQMGGKMKGPSLSWA